MPVVFSRTRIFGSRSRIGSRTKRSASSDFENTLATALPSGALWRRLFQNKLGALFTDPRLRAILGAFLAAHIGLVGLARVDRAEASRRPFYVFLDEFQMFATTSLASMLSELRKYGVSLTLANQYCSQLDRAVRDAVVGNVGTLIPFRVSAADAGHLAGEFEPIFSSADLVALPNYHIYLRLMVDGHVSRPFSARTLAAR